MKRLFEKYEDITLMMVVLFFWTGSIALFGFLLGDEESLFPKIMGNIFAIGVVLLLGFGLKDKFKFFKWMLVFDSVLIVLILLFRFSL